MSLQFNYQINGPIYPHDSYCVVHQRFLKCRIIISYENYFIIFKNLGLIKLVKNSLTLFLHAETHPAFCDKILLLYKHFSISN